MTVEDVKTKYGHWIKAILYRGKVNTTLKLNRGHITFM